MKIGKNGLFHLTYCSNIHPGETWPEVFANLKTHTLKLKKQLAPQTSFGIGLRLADVACRELLAKDNLSQFKSWLSNQQLYVFTLNGFPFGEFHGQRVKEQVYQPDWTESRRRDYSLRLTQILAALVPENITGSFSTSPLAYPHTQTDAAKALIYQKSSIYLAAIVEEMVAIYKTQGKLLHVAIEPEPDCLLETTDDVIHFFQHGLLPIGGQYLAQQLQVSVAKAEQYLLEHVRVCYDICHMAVVFESPAQIFTKLKAAGIQIGKIQISSALKIPIPQNLNERVRLATQLQKLAEPIYLHQVVAQYNDQKLSRYADLLEALPDFATTKAQEWRTHFHVPIFMSHYEWLSSTQDDIIAALSLVKQNNACHYLEIETYTWEVLPPALKIDVDISIVREYEWVLTQFNRI